MVGYAQRRVTGIQDLERRWVPLSSFFFGGGVTLFSFFDFDSPTEKEKEGNRDFCWFFLWEGEREEGRRRGGELRTGEGGGGMKIVRGGGERAIFFSFLNSPSFYSPDTSS